MALAKYHMLFSKHFICMDIVIFFFTTYSFLVEKNAKKNLLTKSITFGRFSQLAEVTEKVLIGLHLQIKKTFYKKNKHHLDS